MVKLGSLSKVTIVVIFITVLILLVTLFYKIYRKGYEEKLLKNEPTKKTWAIYFAERKGKGIMGTSFFYIDSNKNRVEFDKHRYFAGLKIGDTVTIRYSLSDNSVVQIINLKWTDK